MKHLPVGVFILGLSLAAFAAPPKGFDDPGIMKKVMDGDIDVEDALDTPKEFRSYVRAFFNKVGSLAYVDLATNHKLWPGLIPDFKDGKTTKSNADKTEFEWWLHMKVKYGFFTFDVYPEGRQTITHAPDAVSETKIYNLITNYQDRIKLGEQTTRLIPHQGGILVEDNIHVELVEANSQSKIIKREFKKRFVQFVGAFRKELAGNY